MKNRTWLKSKMSDYERKWRDYQRKKAPGRRCYCHNCKHKVMIKEDKWEIVVQCALHGGRIMRFERHTRGGNTRTVCGAWEED